MKPLLDVTHLSISYGSLTAVNDLSFSLNADSTLAIVGESGSGKSSVLRAILGLPERGRSWQGDISMDGQSLLTLPPGKRRALCGSAIAMIFQTPALPSALSAASAHRSQRASAHMPTGRSSRSGSAPKNSWRCSIFPKRSGMPILSSFPAAWDSASVSSQQ